MQVSSLPGHHLQEILTFSGREGEPCLSNLLEGPQAWSMLKTPDREMTTGAGTQRGTLSHQQLIFTRVLAKMVLRAHPVNPLPSALLPNEFNRE